MKNNDGIKYTFTGGSALVKKGVNLPLSCAIKKGKDPKKNEEKHVDLLPFFFLLFFYYSFRFLVLELS